MKGNASRSCGCWSKKFLSTPTALRSATRSQFRKSVLVPAMRSRRTLFLLEPPRSHITFCVRGVLSPVLSNIVLNELDQELERRGHRFTRYADDCNIYVRSRRAGERVMSSVTRLLTTKLKLRVNSEKSAVARPWERKCLGFSFTNHKPPKRSLAP